MNKILFATINIDREDEKRSVKIYKTMNEKYGIEVEFNEGADIKKIDNITSSENKINQFLDVLVNDTQNFELLEDYASDYNDVQKPIEWV